MNNSAKIGILGTGTWGTALARMLSNSGHKVTAWSAIEADSDILRDTHMHKNLPGVVLPDEIGFTKDMQEACTDKDILVFAVPSIYVRSTAQKAAPFIEDGQIIVDVAKGMETDTLLSMTEVIADVLAQMRPGLKVHLVALSGPTHAEEVARDMPSTIVAASTEMEIARYVQRVFSNSVMRVYTNSDIKGVEICGALKNIMAMAAGIAEGLGYGDNLRAAIITRGLAEITRLGKAMGCQEQTFAGLAGVGDLIVTATSKHSRNNRAGFLIGQGMSAKEAIQEVGMVVEGINMLPAAMELMQKYSVELPLAEAVNKVVFENVPLQRMYSTLMEREFTDEVY